MADRSTSNAVKIGGGLAAGATGGFLLGNTTLAEQIVESFVHVLEEQGLFVAVTALLIVATVVLCGYLIRITIRSKDEEIERIVDEKNKLLDRFLNDRPSSRP